MNRRQRFFNLNITVSFDIVYLSQERPVNIIDENRSFENCIVIQLFSYSLRGVIRFSRLQLLIQITAHTTNYLDEKLNFMVVFFGLRSNCFDMIDCFYGFSMRVVERKESI